MVGWLASLTGENPSFISTVIFLKHLLASHHTLFMLIPGSHHLCQFWFQLSQLSGDEAALVRVDRNVATLTAECVCLREVYGTHQ